MLRRALAFALAFAAMSGVLSGNVVARTERHSALILDANTGAVLHEEDGDELRHPASLTKMMTLYLTFETLETGRLKMTDRISISEAAAGVAPSKLDLQPGDEISVSDAIRAVITKSANDIAVALAERIGGSEANFVRLMNARARDIGMAKTHFENASGLPNDDQVTTARDMVTLGLHLQDDYPAYYPLFATRTFTYNGSTYGNHNTMLNSFAGIDGIKTGYTRASGFNLVSSVHRGGRHLVGAVFGGASAATRNGEMRILLTRALTRASSVKTRKPSPMLLAKLKVGPKLAERPAAKPVKKTEVADAAAEPAPRPFAPAKPQRAPAPAVVAAVAAAVETAQDPVLRDMANSQPGAVPIQAPETPVQIFKVRHVPVQWKPRPAPPSPDQTTDMEDTGRSSPDVPMKGLGTPARTDLGSMASNSDEGAASIEEKLAHSIEDINASTSAETRVAKLAGVERRPSPLDDKIAMLGASDALPAPVAAPALDAPVITPVAYTPVSAPVASLAAPNAAPALKSKAKVTSVSPRTLTPARGLPPSTLTAQANAIQSVQNPRIGKPQPAAGRYTVQIGAYASIGEAQRAITAVQGRTGQLLAGITSVTHPAVKDGHPVFRARFTGFNADRAASTCSELRRQAVDCFVMAGE